MIQLYNAKKRARIYVRTLCKSALKYMGSFEICTLASGSKGNCTYIKSGNTSLIVDEGLTVKELKVRAATRGIDLSGVGAVLVTHEHADHIKGVEQFSREFGAKVYMPLTCFETMRSRGETITKFEYVDGFETGFEIDDIMVEPFRLPHDARYTVGYRLSDGKYDVAIATDLGFVSDNTLSKLSGCKAVIVESNHDSLMLQKGRYPYSLKVRIASRNGHLSNADSAAIASQLVASGAERILLAHLSEDNNTPELAFEATKEQLEKHGIREGEDVVLDIAYQYRPSEIIRI